MGNIDKIVIDGYEFVSGEDYLEKRLNQTEDYSYTNPNVTNMPAQAFFNDTHITSFNCPITNIGVQSFAYCNKLTSVSSSLISTFNGNNWFTGCSSLLSIDLPLLNGWVEQNAFTGCSSLKNVNIPNAKGLSLECFQQCGIEEIDLPKVTQISSRALNQCYSLRKVILRHTSVVTLSSQNAFYAPNVTIEIQVPSDLISSYQTATNWSTLYNNSQVTFTAITE